MPVSHSHSTSSSTAVAPSQKVAFATNLTTTINPSSPSSSSTNSSHIGHKKRSSGSQVFVAENSHMQRSVSTPSMASAAMISSEQLVDFERQRQGQMMMTTYISSAIREKKQGNPVPFEELIAQLTVTKPAPLTPAKLLQWVQALSQCISLLDKSCKVLIDAILQIDWVGQDNTFVQNYISFLGHVVSAHAFYVVPVQSMLVKRLTHRYKSSTPDQEPIVSREGRYERAHQALKYILDLIPTGPTSLFPILASEFPHKRESLNAHITYTKNILRVLEYAPVLRAQILSVVIDRIIQVDVEIQVELEELEDSDTEVVYDFDKLDDLEDSDSDSDSDDDDDNSDSDSEAEEVAVLNIKEMTHKLDGMLFLVFSYLEGYVDSCQHLPTVEGQPPMPIQELFAVLLSIFMKTILQTFKSRHTQFLVFYFISLSPQFSDYFLGALGQQILDRSQPQVVRVAAAAYMSSFVARAKYLDVRQVGMVVDMLGGFALEVVEQNDTGSNVLPDAERYAVFYGVVQALLYIFCFRWRVLVIGGDQSKVHNKDDFDSAGMIVGSMDGTSSVANGSAPARQWHSGLAALQRIVTSRLNPLKMCSNNVVKQFARLSNNLNFMYIYPILEQNKKIFIPRLTHSMSLGQTQTGTNGADSPVAGSGETLPHELETFFPFDPYRLRQSAPFMNGIYQEWENDEDDEDEDEDDDEEDEEEYDEEEYDGVQDIDEDEDEDLAFIGRHNAQRQSAADDEDELSMNKSIMAMSISPSPAHFLVQGMNGRLSDLDGTLLTPQDKISPRTIQALSHAQQYHLHQNDVKDQEGSDANATAVAAPQTIKIMIASGRPPRSIQKVINLFGGLMVPDAVLCCNGALNYDPRTKALSLPQFVALDQCLLMIQQLRAQILTCASPADKTQDDGPLIPGRPGFACEVLYIDEEETAQMPVSADGTRTTVYTKDTTFVCDATWEEERKHAIYYKYERIPDTSSMEEFVAELARSGRGGIVKMNALDRNRVASEVYYSLPEELRPVTTSTATADAPKVNLTYSGPYFLEISAAGVTKGLGLAKYCEAQGLDRSEVVAFGDLLNDREMLEFAGLGLCMGNGHPDMKALADRVIGTNADDGVAREVESWFS
ncbi:hypothetical protein BGZ83_010529 [Gryganskiella cystojenkinii]|nr:hypothetical protein BGZ83_010529 [Gryganskiella cystojenkinii]